MRNLILILLFIILSANECNMPYRAKIICNTNRVDSNKLRIDNRLELTIKYSDLGWRYKIIGAAVFCEIKNPTQIVQLLDRHLFSAVSYRGIKFKMDPMQVENKLKVFTVSDKYPVAVGQTADYVFVFSSVDKYSKQQAIDLLKMDTVFVLYNRQTTIDTLFGIVAADKRIK